MEGLSSTWWHRSYGCCGCRGLIPHGSKWLFIPVLGDFVALRCNVFLIFVRDVSHATVGFETIFGIIIETHMFFYISEPLEGDWWQRMAYIFKHKYVFEISDPPPRREPGDKNMFIFPNIYLFEISDPPEGAWWQGRAFYFMMFKVLRVHTGRYRLRFCENGSYIDYLAVGTNFQSILAQENKIKFIQLLFTM